MQLKGIKKRKWDRSTWISGTIDLFLTPEAVIDLHKNILEQFSEIAIGEKRRREVDHAPLNTPKSTTILSSIRLDGTTADKFPNYLKEVLIPTLHQAILW